MIESRPPALASEHPAAAVSSLPLLVARRVSKYFPYRSGFFRRAAVVRAVEDVSFSIGYGETLGLVGESGSGKSTLGRALIRLIEPSFGRVTFEGTDLSKLTERELRPIRRRMQIIFQDPYSSLNPRLNVEEIVGEALTVHNLASSRLDRLQKVQELLARVGLPLDSAERMAHEFSGGQRQRIGIARALAVGPQFIVCDEPTSALDVSIQAQIVNLLCDIQERDGLSYLFISHDLNIVRHVSQRVAVMYLGRIVELAETQELFEHALHPYSRALLAAAPVADPSKRRLRVLVEGDPPSPIDPPTGCSFHPRCPRMVPGRCDVEVPALAELSPTTAEATAQRWILGARSGRFVACFNPFD